MCAHTSTVAFKISEDHLPPNAPLQKVSTALLPLFSEVLLNAEALTAASASFSKLEKLTQQKFDWAGTLKFESRDINLQSRDSIILN